MNATRYRPQYNLNTAHFSYAASASDGFRYDGNDLYDGDILKWDLLAHWTNVSVSPEDKKTAELVTRFANALEKNLSTPGSDEVANCTIDIVKPLLGGFSEEEQRWMRQEIKNICSDVEGCIAKPYRRPAEHRYITFIDERDTSRWRRDAIDSERMWFDVRYTAGIEGLPEENDVINTRTSHIANVHHLLVSLLLHLAMFHTASLNYKDPNIREGVGVIQTILRWAGRLKGGPYDLEDDTPEKDSFVYHMAVGHLPDIDRAFREHYAKVEIMLRQLYWQHERCSSDDSSNGDDSDEGSSDQDYSGDQEMVGALAESSSSEGFCTVQKYLDCFYSLLGRRILILAISYYGRGYHLRERMEAVKSLAYAELCDKELDWQFENGGLDDFESALLDSNQLQMTRRKLNYPHRVIDTTTLEFETEYSFYQNCYAILSHTWSQREEEISFQEAEQVLLIGKVKRLEKLVGDLKNRQGPQVAEKLRQVNAFRAKAGISTLCKSASHASKKLLSVIEAARKLGYRYIWLDNCCIDKTNYDEINEAIPSMGNWYTKAQVCLVYLEDVYQSKISKGEQYAKSVRWAERSWTLQEIVLCSSTVIYNRFWEILYDSRKGTEAPLEVPGLCGVPKTLFCYGQPPPWPAHAILELAARRKAKKPEDKVYSLLGILGVRMEPEYGEGLPAAIARLFKVIVETKNDTSVFNWRDTRVTANTVSGHSMFPSDLVRCMYTPNRRQHNVSKTLIKSPNYETKNTLTVTSAGVRAQFDILRILHVKIGNSQEDTVSRLESIERIVKKSAGTRALPSLLSVSCTLVLKTVWNEDYWESRMPLEKVDLRCDVSLLKERFSTGESTSTWLLARFTGVEAADWFILQPTSLKIPDGRTVLSALKMQAAGPSGLHARRVGIITNTQYEQAYQDFCTEMEKKGSRAAEQVPEILTLIVE